jgi:uncharacterized membrane protein YhaH (DUF805 family)
MDTGQIAKILFSFHGRMGRAAFWVTMIGLALVSGVGQRFGGLIGTLMGLAVLWVMWATLAKRAHDRGRSVWSVVLAAVPFLFSVVSFVIVPGVAGGLMAGLFGAALLAGAGALVFGAWALVGGVWLLFELGIREGEPGANAHGPPVGELLER